MKFFEHSFFSFFFLVFALFSCDRENDGSLQKVSYVVTNVSCAGQRNGGIDLKIEGGYPPFKFKWSNGAKTEDLENIGPGTYSVTWIDANNYTSEQNGIVVSQPSQKLLVNSEVQNVLGIPGENGRIDLTIEGGVPPYSFEWSTGQTEEDISNLNEGNYEVTIADANGCFVSLEISVEHWKETFFDSLNDIEYKIVNIGDQTWFAENLRSTLDRNGNMLESFCYNNEIVCEEFGRFYNRDNALLVCPQGWRLPSDEDWLELESYVSPGNQDLNLIEKFWRGDYGSKLKEGGPYNMNIQMSGNIFLKPDGTLISEKLYDFGNYWSSSIKDVWRETNSGFELISGPVFRGFKASRYSDGEGNWRGITDSSDLLCVRCIKED